MNYLALAQKAKSTWAAMPIDEQRKFESKYGKWEDLDYRNRVRCMIDYLNPKSESHVVQIIQVAPRQTAPLFTGLDMLVNKLQSSGDTSQRREAESGLADYLESVIPTIELQGIKIPKGIVHKLRSSQYNIGELLALADIFTLAGQKLRS